MVKSYLVDTGATDTFVRDDVRKYLKNAKPSSAIIHIADDSTIPASMEGELELYSINTPNYKGLGLGCPFKITATVVPTIAQELLSLSELFAVQGYKISLDPLGTCEMTRNIPGTTQVSRVPIRFDYHKKGFFIDAITCNDPAHHELIAARVNDIAAAGSQQRAKAFACSCFPEDKLSEVAGMLTKAPDVNYVQFCGAATKDPLILRRVLHGNNKGLSKTEAHELYGHKGHHPDCWICKLTLGSARRERTIPPEERVQSDQPGRAFTLDIVQWSHRASTGEMYSAVLRDVCTGTPFNLHLCYKSDFYKQFDAWLMEMRNDPYYNWMRDYKFCSVLYLDNDGLWDEANVKWNATIRVPRGIQCRYSEPDKKNTNARAENNVRAMERRTKSLLFSRNLPPEQWPLCADQGAWLDARFPYNQRSSDGDDILPIEALTNGAHSRRTITQELSFFVSVGTPCLVWKPSVKGSSIEGKVRWGIAQSMRGKTVRFLCPYNGESFLSRSYMAIKLREGVNYWQFLGLKSPPVSNTALIPAEANHPMVITLPDLLDSTYHQPPPVEGIQSSGIPDPKPFVHILDPNGRVFKPDEDGRFCPTDDNKGFLHTLTQQHILPHGWNDTDDITADYNYQVMLLSNRPRDFIGRTFDKMFMVQVAGSYVPECHTGRIVNYNQLKKFWKVKYSDGDAEDFDQQDVLHYVINKMTSNIKDLPKLGDNPTVETTQNAPSAPTKKILPVNIVNDVKTVTFDRSVPSEPTEKLVDLTSSSVPSSDASFTCVYESKLHQLLPRFNNFGEAPPTMDFWNDVTRRITWNDKTNQIIEDLSIAELKKKGATTKLPVNVKRIRSQYFFRDDLPLPSKACYTSKPGDKIKDVLQHLGVRPEYMATYFQFLNKSIDSCLAPRSGDGPYKSYKAYCVPNSKFVAPDGPRWHSLVNAYHARNNAANPDWKIAANTEAALQKEMHLLQYCKRFDLTRCMAEPHAIQRARAFCAVQKVALRHAKIQRLTPESALRISKAVAASQQTTLKELPQDPVTIFEALASEDTQEWMQALNDEEESLDSLGVFLHDQTKDQLRALGITDKFIIPSRYVVTTKRHPDRTIDKLKVRRVIQGHKYAMKRGVHYDDSFAPSPTQDTTRI